MIYQEQFQNIQKLLKPPKRLHLERLRVSHNDQIKLPIVDEVFEKEMKMRNSKESKKYRLHRMNVPNLLYCRSTPYQQVCLFQYM